MSTNEEKQEEIKDLDLNKIIVPNEGKTLEKTTPRVMKGEFVQLIDGEGNFT